MSEINLEAFKNTRLFSLTLRKWGNRARIKDEGALEAYLKIKNAPDPESVTKRGIEENTVTISKPTGEDVSSVSASKMLIRSPELKLVGDAMAAIKGKALGYAMPSFVRPGSYIIKAQFTETIDQMLEEETAKFRAETLPAFLQAYPDAVKAARDLPVKKGGLGPLYLEKDYPTIDALRQKFNIRWQWFSITVPEGLPPEIRAREAKKLEEQFAEAAREVRDALRMMFAKLIDRATERLTCQPGEKKKTFRDSLVGNIDDFFKTFEARNIMEDEELTALVTKAREVMVGVEPERLRTDLEFKDQVREKLNVINEALAPMVEEIQERAFDFSETT